MKTTTDGHTSTRIEKIVFRHRYHKLARLEFTTIRGKSWFKKLKIGQEVTIENPDENFRARVVGLGLMRLRDMSLEFLKQDAEYPGCTITALEHFINLLNSLRAPFWTQAAPDSEMTVITLRRLTSPVKNAVGD